MAILHVKSPNGVVTDFPLKDYLPLAGGVMDGSLEFFAHDFNDPEESLGSRFVSYRSGYTKGDTITDPEYYGVSIAGDKYAVYGNEDYKSDFHKLGQLETTVSSTESFSGFFALKNSNDTIDYDAHLGVLYKNDGIKYARFNWKPLECFYSVNGNHNQVRFTNGFQICAQEFVTSSTANTATTHSFAIPFSAMPVCAAAVNKKALIRIFNMSSTGFSLESNAASTTIRVFAIGKWN